MLLKKVISRNFFNNVTILLPKPIPDAYSTYIEKFLNNKVHVTELFGRKCM